MIGFVLANFGTVFWLCGIIAAAALTTSRGRWPDATFGQRLLNILSFTR